MGMQNDFVKEITNIDEDFTQWYTDIVLKAELADYAETKGCLAIRPYGYAIWENIQKYADQKFKETGVENVYLPILIPEKLLELEKDHWKNHEKFYISGNKLTVNDQNISQDQIYLLQIKSSLKKNDNNEDRNLAEILGINDVNQLMLSETIAVTFKGNLENWGRQEQSSGEPYDFPIVSDFYLHGKAGIIDIQEELIPTFWYNKWHPFEFEFIVNDKIGQQKIFTNLIIISNKAEPESFHFEIEGDNYDFSSDKRNMYFRQEATKELYQNNGSNIIFNRKYKDVAATKYTQEQYYRGMSEEYKNRKYSYSDKIYPIGSTGLTQQVKSSIFPLYYERIDTYDDIYHRYREMSGEDKYDFKNLSGSEVIWDRTLNQFNVVTHIKNNPVDLVGRLRGNSRYKEGKWNIQIPSIIFNQKNESEWNDNIPLPNDLNNYNIEYNTIPSIYQNDIYNWPQHLDTNTWTNRKEARIRDKWIKIRVRYSGKNLAVIHSLITLYNISYS